MPTNKGANTWLSLLWVLVCVVVILVLAYWVTRLLATRGFPGVSDLGGSEHFKILARLALGRDQSLVLVQAGARYLLLGVTSTNISNLAELSADEAESWLNSQKTPPAPPSFRQAVQQVLHQRNQQRNQR